jgi:hypothetical protein
MRHLFIYLCDFCLISVLIRTMKVSKSTQMARF